MYLDKIKTIPEYQVVTYAQIILDDQGKKNDQKHASTTSGINLIKYTSELATHTEDITTSKVIHHSTISSHGARCMFVDAGNFYLTTPLDPQEPEYMIIPVELIL